MMWANFVFRKIFGFHGDRLKEYFDDLELDSVLPKLMSYMHEVSNAQNVVWLHKDEYQRLKNIADHNMENEPVQLVNRQLYLQATKNVNEPEILDLLRTFSNDGLSAEWHTVSGHNYAMVPVIPTKMNEPAGYLLFCDFPGSRPEKTVQRISKDLSYMARHLYFSFKHWEIQKQAFIDELSGLYNQTYMQLVLDAEIQRSQRTGSKFSVLFMDVDYFKTINDSNGHWIGSRVLSELGRIFKKNIRQSDYGFRYGGDEFVVVLPSADSEQSVIAAERLRKKIESTDFLIDGVHLKLTLSIGLATYPDHAKSYKDIIKMADEAMYCGKNKSRNVVFVAS